MVGETSPRSDAANLLEENLLGEQMEEEREKRRIAAGGDPLDKGDGDAIDAMGKTWRTSKSLAGVRKLVRLHMPAVHKIAESENFNNVILVVIALNTVVMMTRHYPESDDFADANVVMEYCFNGIFIAEFVIKHLGYGLGGYWSVGWNRLDGFVVIGAVVIAATIVPLFLPIEARLGDRLTNHAIRRIERSEDESASEAGDE